MVTDADFDELKESFDRYRKVVDTLLGNLLQPALDVPGTIQFGANLAIDPNGIISERQRGSYTIEATAGNFGASIPAGNYDIDQNQDGAINILDVSFLSATYPWKDSSYIWVNRRTGDRVIPITRPWTGGATPGRATGGSLEPMSSITGISMAIPNGIMTEATQLDIGSGTSWGAATLGTHGTVTGATDADASAVLQTHKADGTIKATLLVYSEDDGVCYVAIQDAPFWLPVLTADPGSPQNGMAWYNSTSNLLKARINGATVTLGGTLTTLLLTDTAWAAKGDLVVGTANDTASILSKGDDGKVLTANSATATGLEWQTPAAGSFSYGKAITTSQGQNLP